LDVPVFDTEGTRKGSIPLPPAFASALRPDLIRKAVSVAQANHRQPYGASPMAGRRQTHQSWGPGRGASRIPRGTQRARATFAPSVVGGRRAHPPRATKVLTEKLNVKERRAAVRAALAATANVDTVRSRGHQFELEALPLVVDDAFTDVATTKGLIETLTKLGVGGDLDRARSGRHQRAGRGKLRGRRIRTPSSVLVVVHEAGPVVRASTNLPGVEFCLVDQLNVERLAPGGDQGRLTLFTRSAIEALAAGVAA